jgi:hypothetical protein
MGNPTGDATANSTNETAELIGTWALQMSTPFGTQPVTFTVEQTGGGLSGRMSHERGAADVSNIQVRAGAEFTAHAAVTLKGTPITADIEGRIDGAQMNGTVRVHLPIAPPVKFTGVKQ